MDKESIKKWIIGNERGMRFLCYFNLIIFSCGSIFLLWVGSSVMNDSNSLIEDTAGGLIVVLALVLMLIANGQLDALWSMKIEKRLKALEELHRTELGLGVPIIWKEGVPQISFNEVIKIAGKNKEQFLFRGARIGSINKNEMVITELHSDAHFVVPIPKGHTTGGIKTGDKVVLLYKKVKKK